MAEVDDPVDFEQVLKEHRLVMAAEAANVHSRGLDEFPDDYPPKIRDLVLEGRTPTALEYLSCKGRQIAVMREVSRQLLRDDYDAAVTLATIGTAPDPSTTGDPAFNSPWSFTGLPTVSFPIGLARDGLPLAIQFIGVCREDDDLLRTAEWCEDAFRSSRE
jgi:Asp-tRNA(Asn)/Glu-tRNA(Gln) amidotransferase A subunit family amidase